MSKIEDNFLGKREFDELQKGMMGSVVSWFYNDSIDRKDDIDKFQFIHLFYSQSTPPLCSPYLKELRCILDKIKPLSLLRIKANLLTRTPEIVKNAFHVDPVGVLEEKLKQWTTSIFYINTNNGYTEFEDGTQVESVANRIVTFPANMKHCGTSCTDKKTRIVINFNYWK